MKETVEKWLLRWEFGEGLKKLVPHRRSALNWEIPLETYLTLAMAMSVVLLAGSISLAHFVKRRVSRHGTAMDVGREKGLGGGRGHLRPAKDRVEWECKRAKTTHHFLVKIADIHNKLEELQKREKDACLDEREWCAEGTESKGICEPEIGIGDGAPGVDCTCSYMSYDTNNGLMPVIALRDIQIEIEEIRTDLVEVKKKSEILKKGENADISRKGSSGSVIVSSGDALDGSDCTKFYATEDDSNASKEARCGSERGDILVDLESLVKIDSRIDRCQTRVKEILDGTTESGSGSRPTTATTLSQILDEKDGTLKYEQYSCWDKATFLGILHDWGYWWTEKFNEMRLSLMSVTTSLGAWTLYANNDPMKENSILESEGIEVGFTKSDNNAKENCEKIRAGEPQ
ncbi:hypothetical protein AAG570_002898 [Ranatra chinensis]|uniref:Uncharacterized protein n=1 Tax=Ranatra chinensis TaxID=642074 RepID=A0ABD0Y568_9HEMI